MTLMTDIHPDPSPDQSSDPATETGLTARNVGVQLGRKTILDGIDMGAATGQVTCIVGPNGSGKTTLLRALTGEICHTGTIRLGGRDLSGMAPHELAGMRGVLPQATPLSFPFTVSEVVGLGRPAARDPVPIRHALAEVGLGDYGARFYQELSGGEQQRVQLARVLLQVRDPSGPDGPRWLFLDEPVSALDIAHQMQVIRIARDHARAGGGVLAVMHDLNLTALFADRVLVLKAGRVLADGPVSQIITAETLSRAYGCEVTVGRHPQTDLPVVLPPLL